MSNKTLLKLVLLLVVVWGALVWGVVAIFQNDWRHSLNGDQQVAVGGRR